jgi:hypothetical protein
VTRYPEGFSHFVTSIAAPVALERSPGGTCTHWKAPPFHGAHPIRTLTINFGCDAQLGSFSAANCDIDD